MLMMMLMKMLVMMVMMMGMMLAGQCQGKALPPGRTADFSALPRPARELRPARAPQRSQNADCYCGGGANLRKAVVAAAPFGIEPGVPPAFSG